MPKIYPPIASRGSANAKIMVVGEAPGAAEEVEGLPFVGASGKLLDEMLSSVGISPSDVFYTNLCRIRPPSNEIRAFFDSAGVPNETVMEGLSLLKSEIAHINPNVIIPLGNYPLALLTPYKRWKKDAGYTGIGDYRGYVLQGSPITGGAKCIPTYHPAAILRQYSLKHIAKLDFRRAFDQSRFPEIRHPRKTILIDPQGLERSDWLAWLGGQQGALSPEHSPRVIRGQPGWETDTPDQPKRSIASAFLSADIEYVGDKLLCIGLTRSSDVSVVIPTRTLDDIALVRDILLSGVPLCFQNGMFDCSILEWFYNIPCVKYLRHDTMIAMHAAYTEFPKDLGFIGSIFEAQHPWWHGLGAEYWNGVKAGTRDPEECFIYNGGDVWNTHHAMESMLADELTEPEVLATYEHEMSLIKPLWDISRKGVKVDVAGMQKLRAQLESEDIDLSAGLMIMNGGVEINPKSPPQVAKFLYDHLGCPRVGGKTAGGAWKMDDSTLANIQLKCRDESQRTAIKMVRAVRERRDLISKFCEIDLDSDGRMRCHYDPAKTETGRLSSRKFYPTGNGANLQNIPRDPRVRAVFVPDPGYVFGYADLKSAESLVVAHITGDPEMLRLHSPEYMDGRQDGHRYVASLILGKPQDQITKDERHLGKTIRHAGNYGLSWFKFMQLVNAKAQETGVSVNAATSKQIVEGYRRLHWGLEPWWAATLSQLWSTHTLYTLHNRKRVFYGRPDEVLPEAIAYRPQGTVAQQLNMGLLRCATEYSTAPIDEDDYNPILGSPNWMLNWDLQHMTDWSAINSLREASGQLNSLGFQMLLQVHDAIGFQIPEQHVDAAIPRLMKLMDVPIQISRRGIEPYTISIPVDVQVGYNWGEADSKNPNGLKKWKPNSLPATSSLQLPGST